MRGGTRTLITAAGLVGVTLSGCAGGSSGGESGSVGSSGATSSCSSDSFDVKAASVAPAADRVGIGEQATPSSALQASLTRGLFPYFGGNGGTGLVGRGYPASGWRQLSVHGDKATFEAPRAGGDAQLTLTRVDGRWFVSHGELKQPGC